MVFLFSVFHRAWLSNARCVLSILTMSCESEDLQVFGYVITTSLCKAEAIETFVEHNQGFQRGFWCGVFLIPLKANEILAICCKPQVCFQLQQWTALLASYSEYYMAEVFSLLCVTVGHLPDCAAVTYLFLNAFCKDTRNLRRFILGRLFFSLLLILVCFYFQAVLPL